MGLGSAHQATGHTGVGHGEFLGNHVDWVNGAIDDVHIFQSALNESGILMLAHSVLGGRTRSARLNNTRDTRGPGITVLTTGSGRWSFWSDVET